MFVALRCWSYDLIRASSYFTSMASGAAAPRPSVTRNFFHTSHDFLAASPAGALCAYRDFQGRMTVNRSPVTFYGFDEIQVSSQRKVHSIRQYFI
jgi:hypothetical protein